MNNNSTIISKLDIQSSYNSLKKQHLVQEKKREITFFFLLIRSPKWIKSYEHKLCGGWGKKKGNTKKISSLVENWNPKVFNLLSTWKVESENLKKKVFIYLMGVDMEGPLCLQTRKRKKQMGGSLLVEGCQNQWNHLSIFLLLYFIYIYIYK